MAGTADKQKYFTKHLFGAGLECPTKLYYKARDYPENRESAPFIEHAVFNKRLLKSLARAAFESGEFIEGDSLGEAAGLTKRHLSSARAVLFDAIFVHEQMMARLPLLVKEDNRLTVFHIQVKAFDSRKHRLVDRHGQIHDKWRKYLLDFAYQLYILRQNYPELDINPLLVLPDKSGKAHTEMLPHKLRPYERHHPYDVVSPEDQSLLVKLPVKEYIERIWNDPGFAEDHLPRSTFEESLRYLKQLYLHEEKETPEIGRKCRRCEFRISGNQLRDGEKSGFNECWFDRMDTDSPSEKHVFDLIGSGINNWMENEDYDQRDLALDHRHSPKSISEGNGRISHEMRQSLQLYKVQGKEVPDEICRPELFNELDRWKYPLHFLDFEAGNYSVPVRKGGAPYQLVVFQYSCHTLREDGEWEHHQWIDDLNSGYPNYELVRRLREIPALEEGTIVQYSNFERHALKIIRNELERDSQEVADSGVLTEWIEDFLHRNDSTHDRPPYIADLSRQVKDFYYNCEMENSLSIKDVLRSVMSHSSFLKDQYSQLYYSHNFDGIIWWRSDGGSGARNPYHILMETGESPIRRGTEAMVVYGKLISRRINEEERRAYRNALFKYCELDTLAMMMIYQHWKWKMTGKQ